MKVKCIDDKYLGSITKGIVYDVLGHDGNCYRIINDVGDETVYAIGRFKVVEEDAPKEAVNHPGHYNKGIEVWDFIISHDMDFMAGNIVKYVARYKHKNGVQDLEKALFYLQKLIEVEKNK